MVALLELVDPTASDRDDSSDEEAQPLSKRARRPPVQAPPAKKARKKAPATPKEPEGPLVALADSSGDETEPPAPAPAPAPVVDSSEDEAPAVEPEPEPEPEPAPAPAPAVDSSEDETEAPAPAVDSSGDETEAPAPAVDSSDDEAEAPAPAVDSSDDEAEAPAPAAEPEPEPEPASEPEPAPAPARGRRRGARARNGRRLVGYWRVFDAQNAKLRFQIGRMVEVREEPWADDWWLGQIIEIPDRQMVTVHCVDSKIHTLPRKLFREVVDWQSDDECGILDEEDVDPPRLAHIVHVIHAVPALAPNLGEQPVSVMIRYADDGTVDEVCRDRVVAWDPSVDEDNDADDEDGADDDDGDDTPDTDIEDAPANLDDDATMEEPEEEPEEEEPEEEEPEEEEMEVEESEEEESPAPSDDEEDVVLPPSEPLDAYSSGRAPRAAGVAAAARVREVAHKEWWTDEQEAQKKKAEADAADAHFKALLSTVVLKTSDMEVARYESILQNTGKLVEIGLSTAAELEAATFNLRRARIINSAGDRGMSHNELHARLKAGYFAGGGGSEVDADEDATSQAAPAQVAGAPDDPDYGGSESDSDDDDDTWVNGEAAAPKPESEPESESVDGIGEVDADDDLALHWIPYFVQNTKFADDGPTIGVHGETCFYLDVTSEMYETMFVEESQEYNDLTEEYWTCFDKAVANPPVPYVVADMRAAGLLAPRSAPDEPAEEAASDASAAAAASSSSTALTISDSKSPSDKSDKSDKPVKLKDRSVAERKAAAGVTHVGSHAHPASGHSQKWRKITKQRKKIPIAEDHVRLDMAAAIAAIEGNFKNGGGKMKPMVENKDDWRLRKADGTYDTRRLKFVQMHPPYGGWHLYVPSTYPDDRLEVGGATGDSNYQHINTKVKRDCLLDPAWCTAGEQITMEELQARAVARKARIAIAKKQKATNKGIAAIKAGKSLHGTARPRKSAEKNWAQKA